MNRKRGNNNNKNIRLNILHYNCTGLLNGGRIRKFELALSKIDWDIVGLAEVRKMGECLKQQKNGNYSYIFYFGTKKGYSGIGFYLKGNICMVIRTNKKKRKTSNSMEGQNQE